MPLAAISTEKKRKTGIKQIIDCFKEKKKEKKEEEKESRKIKKNKEKKESTKERKRGEEVPNGHLG